MRIGTKKKPFYRVVVVDERAKRTGGYIELLGTYNPLTEPKDIKLQQDKIDGWIKKGAQPSVGFLRITGKAPQRLPRKPKKEKANGKAEVAPAEEVQKPLEADVTPENTASVETADSDATNPSGSPEENLINGKEEVKVESTEQTQSEESETMESTEGKNEGSA